MYQRDGLYTAINQIRKILNIRFNTRMDDVVLVVDDLRRNSEWLVMNAIHHEQITHSRGCEILRCKMWNLKQMLVAWREKNVKNPETVSGSDTDI